MTHQIMEAPPERRRGRFGAGGEHSAAVSGLGWQTFRALENRDYRLLWFGQMGNSASLWVETVARSWLVYQLTESALLLGMVNVFRAAPLLIFGLFAGVIADRMDKRRLLLISQIVTMLSKLVLAVLITFQVVEVWHVFLTAFIAGSSMAFQQPTRTSLIPALVKRDQLMNAVALNNLAANATRIVGPSAAGLLVAPLGIDGVYYLSSFVYLLTVAATFLMQAPKTASRAAESGMWSNLKEGLAYIWQSQVLLALMLLALIPMTFGMPYMSVMPVLADKVLGLGATGLGFLYTASGVGAIVGAMTVASLATVPRKGLVMSVGVFLFGLAIVAAALSPWWPLTFVAVALAGCMSTSYMAMNNSALLEHSSEEFHGRVMSIYMLDRGLQPLGTVVVGTLADLSGVSLALTLMGAMCMALAAGALVWAPALRKIT